ncbi:MAG: RsiV family protein [Lachnospiraceae bacterium]|nr:RsiV family protein [Lachnospiraceae bacterium]
MKKRSRLVVLFALLAGLVLTACGTSSGEPENSSVQETEAVGTETTEPEADSTEEESLAALQTEPERGDLIESETSAAGSETPSSDDTTAATAALKVSSETTYRNWYSEDGEQWLMQAECDSIQVQGEGFDLLCEAVNLWNEEQTASFWESCEELAGEAAESVEEAETDSGSYYYDARREIEVTRADESVLSLTILSYSYVGGVHGDSGYTSVNFSAESGEILMLNDILEDADGFQAAAQAYIVEKLGEEYGDELFEGYEETVTSTWDAEPVWYLDAEGITFVFNPYEVGPYSMGTACVTCPYEEVSNYMKEEYVGLQGTGSAQFSENTEIKTESGTVTVKMEADEDYGMSPISVCLDGESVSAGEFGSFGRAFLLQLADGRSFVLFDADYMSDDYVTFLYEITDGSITLRSRLESVSLEKGTVSAGGMTLLMRLGVLGNYDSLMEYEIGEDGTLAQTEEVFEILQDGYAWHILTLVKELPVTIDGEAAVLPEGSRIRITGTDNAGTAYFTEEDTGESGSISYEYCDEENVWELYIDGVSEYEYFEMLPYAG